MALFPASGASRQSVLSQDQRERRVSSHVRFANLRVFAKHFAGKRRRAAILLLTPLVTGIAWAAPTDLDWHWDADGMLFPPAFGAGSIEQMVLQDDGSLIIATSVSHYEGSYLTRFDQFGGRDATFGNSGRVGSPQPAESPSSSYQVAGMTFRQDGRLDVQWYHLMWLTPGYWECIRVWTRHLPSGQPDRSFAANGIAASFNTNSRTCGAAAHRDSSGNWYRTEVLGIPYAPETFKSTIRVNAADGTHVGFLEPFDGSTWWYIGLKVDARDRLVIGLASRQGTNSGFAIGRTGAGSFGNDGIALVQLPGTPSAPGVHPLPDGGVLAFGSIGEVDATGARQAVVVRFTEDGKPDAGFGEGGAVVIPFARAGDTGVRQVEVAPLRDGRLLVVAEVDGSVDAWRKFVHLRMACLMPNGGPDTSFAADGIATVWTNGETLLHDGPIVRPSGEFLVASSNVVYQFRGGDLPVPYPPAQRAAVEYVHAAYGHYFVTADVLELATLDASAASGWARTGKSFTVYGSSESGLAPVCRFWSGQSFAPKSSHFYTPYADECAKVKQDPVWQFERNAFHVRMPEGVSGARTCPSGTQPLYRAYNDGQGGAPNHRYTTDPAVLDAMIAQGWTMEGEAATRVFACVPTPG